MAGYDEFADYTFHRQQQFSPRHASHPHQTVRTATGAYSGAGVPVIDGVPRFDLPLVVDREVRDRPPPVRRDHAHRRNRSVADTIRDRPPPVVPKPKMHTAEGFGSGPRERRQSMSRRAVPPPAPELYHSSHHFERTASPEDLYAGHDMRDGHGDSTPLHSVPYPREVIKPQVSGPEFPNPFQRRDVPRGFVMLPRNTNPYERSHQQTYEVPREYHRHRHREEVPAARHESQQDYVVYGTPSNTSFIETWRRDIVPDPDAVNTPPSVVGDRDEVGEQSERRREREYDNRRSRTDPVEAIPRRPRHHSTSGESERGREGWRDLHRTKDDHSFRRDETPRPREAERPIYVEPMAAEHPPRAHKHRQSSRRTGDDRDVQRDDPTRPRKGQKPAYVEAAQGERSTKTHKHREDKPVFDEGDLPFDYEERHEYRESKGTKKTASQPKTAALRPEQKLGSSHKEKVNRSSTAPMPSYDPPGKHSDPRAHRRRRGTHGGRGRERDEIGLEGEEVIDADAEDNDHDEPSYLQGVRQDPVTTSRVKETKTRKVKDTRTSRGKDAETSKGKKAKKSKVKDAKLSRQEKIIENCKYEVQDMLHISDKYGWTTSVFQKYLGKYDGIDKKGRTFDEEVKTIRSNFLATYKQRVLFERSNWKTRTDEEGKDNFDEIEQIRQALKEMETRDITKEV